VKRPLEAERLITRGRLHGATFRLISKEEMEAIFKAERADTRDLRARRKSRSLARAAK